MTRGWKLDRTAETGLLTSATDVIEPAVPARPILGQGLTIFWTALLIGALVWAQSSDQAMFLIFGWATCLIVTMPVLRPAYDLVSPWSLVLLTIYVGCGLRPWFIAFRIEGARDLDALFLLGQPVAFFTGPSLIFMLGTALFTLGYCWSRPPSIRHSSAASEPRSFARHADLVIVACAAVGLVAFVLFVQRTGGFSLTTLSAKRTNIGSLDLSGYQSFGILRALSDLSSYAFWLAVAMTSRREVGRTSMGRRLYLVTLFLNAVALPVYSSTRADAGYILIIGVVIHLCLQPAGTRRIGRTFVRGAVVVTLIVSALTALRAASAADSSVAEQLSIGNTLGQTFVYNRNFTDIPSSAQIIAAVPDKIGTAWGSTYAAWAVAWIPRELWPEKPLISAGPLIGVRVFGQASSGVPPGLVAEAYWNFGLAGVILICLLMGLLLRRIYDWWLPRLRGPAAAVVYAGAFMRLGEGITANGVGYALFQTASAAVVLTGLLALILVKPVDRGPSRTPALSEA